MSAKSFLVVSRRLWEVRTQLGAAFIVFDTPRMIALQRRADRLQELLLSFQHEEGRAA